MQIVNLNNPDARWSHQNGTYYSSNPIACVNTPKILAGNLILRCDIRFDKHLTKLLEFFWASYFLGQKGKLNDMEKFVIEFMSFIKVFLLHLLTDTAMLAI